MGDHDDWTTHERVVAQDILRYLFARPRARDSIRVIAEWWIRRQRIEEAVNTVARVVRRLVEEGLLVEHGDPPGYGVNPDRLGEIKALVQPQ